MSPASRRTLIYWLLLLAPTTLAGVGAIELLRREQTRLAGQEASASEARRAAVAARAGLIVENVELLVGDVQTGLLETLSGLPADRVDEELARWRKNNPLVRTAFRCTPDGAIIYPPAVAPDEEARGFRRRFGPRLSANPPWRTGVSAVPEAKEEAPSLAAGSRLEERKVRQQAYANVAQVQSARRDAQAASKSMDYSVRAPAASASADRPGLALADDGDRADGRQGWLPWSADGRRHLLGWVEMPALGEVRGVEVELTALISRLAAALPAEAGEGEGYALRDERGRIMHQAGFIPRNAVGPASRVSLAGSALAGWDVVAFLDAPTRGSATGAGYFVVGSLLVGILMVAIVAGGALLVRQARQSEAEALRKTSFVANVSHEFKTPLTTIRLYSELLEQGRVAEEGRKSEYLRTIGRETQRLARLVGNALEFSRLEQGRRKYASDPVDVRAALSALLEIHAPRLGKAGLSLRCDVPPGTLVIATDRDAIEQIVLNLLDNAAKYAAGGGEVAVELSALSAGGARVRVLDRGPGVPAEHRALIFEKFHRVDDTLTAGRTGTGLGLSIARQLARGLGGDLRFEPRDGGGSVFILDLP